MPEPTESAQAQRAYSLSDREHAVRRAFYRRFDNYSAGVSYIVHGVYDTDLVAYAEHEEKWYRLGYTFSEEAEPAQRVTFAEPSTWQEVVWEWVDVQRDLEGMKAAKRALLSEDEPVQQTREMTEPSQAFRAFRPEIRFSSNEERTTFLIMTEAVARDGAVVRADGLDTRAYMDNPVVLWQHGRDPQRGYNPIGRTVSLERKRSAEPSQNGWLATVEWASDDFAQNIKRQVKDGFISMASLGWSGRAEMQRVGNVNVPVYEQSEMLEFSVVGIGSDRNALALSRAGADPDRLSAIERTLTEIKSQLEARGATAPAASDEPDAAATAGASVSEEPAEERANMGDGASTAPALIVVDASQIAALRQEAERMRRESEARMAQTLLSRATGKS